MELCKSLKNLVGEARFPSMNCANISAMFYSIPRLSLLLSTTANTLNPVVNLTYASYRGVQNPIDGVTQWLGIRYAAPPLGDLRFAAPSDPHVVKGVQNADKHAPYCLGVGAKPPFAPETSEDCLFLDVFAPSNATTTSALPVYFFIQGGGFASNANANFNGRGLVEASGHNIVVVTFNYRVGAYGFISGDKIQSANNGLKDQRKAMEWVQRHISLFGGNPKHVVLGGDSAGAGSITFHLSAYGGRNDNLFHAAAAESQSFPTVLTANESQYLYDDLVSGSGCASSSDSLACLRKLSTADLQGDITSIPYPGQSHRPLYSWAPVIDGDLIQDYTYRAFNSGKFISVPTIFGDDTNGGTVFVPRSTDTLSDSNKFLQTQFPYLTSEQIKILNDLYPKAEEFLNSGAYWRQASNVYGEMRYMCPGLFLSSAYSAKKASAWNYRYNVQDPDQIKMGIGVPHTVEVNAIFGPGNVGGAKVPASYLPGGKNAEIVPVIQAYWTSFIRSFDPNTHRIHGTAEWEKWDEKKMNRFLFDSPIKHSRMEDVDEQQRSRCAYLWSIAVAVRQ